MNEFLDITEDIISHDLKNHREDMNFTIYDHMLQRVRHLSERRIEWLRKIWTENGANSNGNETFNSHSEVDGWLHNSDNPASEAVWFNDEKTLQSLNSDLRKTEKILEQDDQSRIAQLVKIFGLDPAEKDIIQACLSMIIDPNLGRVYAYLQDHNGRGYVTTSLVARLFGHGFFLPLSSSSPLISWGLVKEIDMGRGEPSRLDIDPSIRNWLLGSDDIDDTLSGIAQTITLHQPLRNWPVNETVKFITQILNNEHAQRIRIFIAGPEGSGRRSFAAMVCRQLGMNLLALDSDRIAEQNWPQIFIRAQRQAFIDRSVLLWYGAAIFEWHWTLHRSCQLQFIIGEADESPLPAKDMIDHRIVLPQVEHEEACRLLVQFIPAARHWPKEEIEQLVMRHQLSVGQLTTASKKEIKTASEASEILRSTNRQRLGKLAQYMTSSFCWDDLVIPAWLRAYLNDFYFEANERAALWEQPGAKRLFPQSRGLVALFTGAPGTGKTMAAQVIANHLRLDLFRIDLSAIVSKYVGETSKNIERILSRARTMDAVLLFDEADALFGKRTDIKDAHDRFANTDTNYLLQAIEDYPGIAIMASNQKARIDSSFMRRLRYVLEFPKPDKQQRLELWRRIILELAGRETVDSLDKSVLTLAEKMETTGAQIKLSVLSAVFMARQDQTNITTAHLIRGLERELMKEGRGIGSLAQNIKK